MSVCECARARASLCVYVVVVVVADSHFVFQFLSYCESLSIHNIVPYLCQFSSEPHHSAPWPQTTFCALHKQQTSLQNLIASLMLNTQTAANVVYQGETQIMK